MSEPKRFQELMRASGRRRDMSRAAVAIFKADSRLALVLKRRLADAGLTLPQFNVLMELASSKGATLPLYELNSRLISTPPNMSWLCTKMEDDGLVRRRRDDADSRVVNVELTETGWKALSKAAPLIFEAEREAFKGFSSAELRTLASLLSRHLQD